MQASARHRTLKLEGYFLLSSMLFQHKSSFQKQTTVLNQGMIAEVAEQKHA